MINLKNSETINLLGREYRINFSNRKLLRPRVVIKDSEIIVYQSELNEVHHKTILLKFLKEFARTEITKRTKKFSNAYGFEINKIAIRDQSSRWGSCSSLKNLNFNWRLIFAPSGVLDYVIVHELCHTAQMNHSKAFWDLVTVVMPDWKTSRRWLRENSRTLEISN
jgi:predicted metal-dependent hydrolase